MSPPAGPTLAALVREATRRGLHLRSRSGDQEVVVTSVAYDSRVVGPGALFCSLPGERVDGHDFAPAAVAAGAVALLTERQLGLGVAQLVVDDARAAMAPLAAAFYGDPSRDLLVAGITGTNGKTTTCHLLAAVLEHAGRPTGVIGTLSGVRTTPEAPDLQARLAAFRDEGKQAVTMEVSSHALALHRVDATHFAVAVFTMLGRDHLDFHQTPERYFAAKARLFEPDLAALGVTNTDDPHGRLLLDAASIPMVGYSRADAVDAVVEAARARFTWRGRPVELRLGGWFNVTNAVAAATAAAALGVPEADVARGLSAAPAVPGRFEPVDVGLPFTVVVDYAHTPDGLAEALGAAREATDGRVLVVFGCGGDRDPTKRPAMGGVAATLADVAVVTSDNPRSEDPAAIISAVLSGVPADASARLHVEPDRRRAIAVALGAAAPGDVVLVAGKGHETTQVVGERVVAFDDRVVAREEARGLAR